MAFCKNCGEQLPENAANCPKCGTAVAGAAKPAGEKKELDFSDKLAELNNTKDSTAELDPADIEKNKLMAVLAYLSWLVLIPLFAAKDSKYARFHVNQGLVLAIAEIVFGIARSVVVTVIGAIIPFLGGIIDTVLGLVTLAFLILSIVGIVNAATGKAKELPIIGSITLIK